MFMKKCSDVPQTEAAAPEPPKKTPSVTTTPEPEPEKPKKKCKSKKSATELPYCDEAPAIPPPPPTPTIIIADDTPPPKKKRSCDSCLCLERVRNPPLPTKEQLAAAEDPRINCVVKRQLPGTARCDRILALTAATEDDDDAENKPPPPGNQCLPEVRPLKQRATGTECMDS
ncbi:hypothetical protein B5X24_HaOG212345 [Helicoverpa armigera]|nr:hypothetical protein B5X24_HaOG212345 [Helicoverpa armigera]